MDIKKVEWKSGVATRGISATIAHEELLRIRAKHNDRLTDESVLNEAKDASNPLHKWFTWDDTEAARQHRLREAQKLIQSLTITYVHGPKEPVRVFTILEKQPRKSVNRTVYTTTAEMMQDPLTREQLINDAIADLVRFRKKFATLIEFKRLVESIDEVMDELCAQGKVQS